MMSWNTDERGISAIWIAVVAVFLLASAALAIDISGGFNTARTDQTTADLSCLAGVQELPDDPTQAINVTVAYVGQNWPQMVGQTLTTTGATTADYTDGNGNAVHIDVAYGGDPSKEYVRVTEIQDSFFGRIIGVDSISVTQEAACSLDEFSGTATLPFGASPTWDGLLQVKNPCDTGNCRPLDVPRSDVNGISNTFIRNVALGTDRELAPGSDIVCTNSTPVCDIIDQYPGVTAGQLADGVLRERGGVPGRLRDTSVADTPLWVTPGGRSLDGDSVDVILGASMTATPPSPPSQYVPEVHGVFSGWYVDGLIGKCTSPRLVKVPIIAQVGWKYPNEITLPPGKSDPVQVIGFFDAVIVDPNDDGDLGGGASDNLKTASAEIWWPGPNATCEVNGKILPWSEVTDGFKAVRLVAP